jgi:AAA family ATP:ADP antiporter
MLRAIIQKTFDVREGEFKISFWMLGYVFLIVAVLLIIKPTVNALFLSRLGVEQLPWAFLAVAVTAIISSAFYSRALSRFALNKIIEATLASSITILVLLGALLKLGLVSGWILFLFYVWVAIYALLGASQFWVLANLVFNPREAKRLFGFIGSGAILGGIFGGYLTSLITPLIGTEFTLILAAALLIPCFSLLSRIWKLRVHKLNAFKQKKRLSAGEKLPFKLIIASRHLTYIAAIVAVSVLVAKLVDYLFSDFAAAAIPDPDALSSYFGFWFSTFNLLSLAIQLFLTRRIVGIWGVGFSLMLLPLGILAGSLLFLFLPGLSAILVAKAMDGILKQSVHKSANELLSLPLPFELKNSTKSFIDVVVDSIATGIAGFLLIFVIRGLDLPSWYIAMLIVLLVALWMFFIFRVRQEYVRTYRRNLEYFTQPHGKARKKQLAGKGSVITGMRTVFQGGNEEQILFMLGKLMEINDKRFEADVQQLLHHPSLKVQTAAIQNLYFLNDSAMVAEVPRLLGEEDEALTLATLQYILLHAQKSSSLVYDTYLDHENPRIAENALFCLAQEARDNYSLKKLYALEARIEAKLSLPSLRDDTAALKRMLRIVGAANIKKLNPFIGSCFDSGDESVVLTAIEAAGASMDPAFVGDLLQFLPGKRTREAASRALENYGNNVLPELAAFVGERRVPEAVCRFIPHVLKRFQSQEAVGTLLRLLGDKDLSIRLEVVRALGELRRTRPELKFNRYKVGAVILEECTLYHQTLSAMHTQIIISYRNRKRSGKEVGDNERDARESLLELLERRLEAVLERIFGLLGLKYPQRDVAVAYEGLLSRKHEAQANAIDFLDNLLTGSLKRRLLPIIEEGAIDTSSEEVLQKIKHKIPSERECFQLLLEGNDFKVKLAVLYLIMQQGDPNYSELVDPYLNSGDKKIRTFATRAMEALAAAP